MKTWVKLVVPPGGRSPLVSLPRDLLDGMGLDLSRPVEVHRYRSWARGGAIVLELRQAEG